ncbi:glycoside hydrolase family 3 protein [Klebsiella spallanzanii]|uniref:glycoside hydrolase family 3 protein n=1 Tax=Klebsiella spallanzanii TaxID=2587528 RepID=UPI001158CB3C|nr:glycoside hydrolase family 3 C-terminal domain-containing protein [Klebsiella spallanzanii]VUT01974.1 Thermostable beta-glucosidase B [Klebsiella spallanzanii]
MLKIPPKISAVIFGTLSVMSFTSVAENKTSPTEIQKNQERASVIVNSLTQSQKLQLIHGVGRPSRANPTGWAGKIQGIPSAKIPDVFLADGPNGVGNGSTDVTAFPTPLSNAATFDRELIFKQGEALGRENRTKGNSIALAPTVNILRVPQWGRTFESFSEDPYLSAESAVAVVKGIQSTGVMASVKHFAGNNQEHGRYFTDSQIDERTLREIYLPSFEAAVKEGGALTVMCGYNRINGAYACENNTLLNEILKKDWQFPGVVVSDWAGTHSAAGSANAGLDLEMPYGPEPGYPKWFGKPLEEAISKGEVKQSRIDDMAKRVVYTLIASGQLDNPINGNRAIPATSPEHSQLARMLSENGIVLLKNRDNILPISSDKVKTLAIIGPNADKTPVGTGAGSGSASVDGGATVSPLQALKEKLNGKVNIEYAEGTYGTAALPTLKTDDGWEAKYFSTSDFTGKPVHERIEAGIDFKKEPFTSLKTIKKWSAQWRSKYTPPASGTYRFSLDTAGIAKLYINNKLVLSNFGQDRATVAHALVEMKAGEPVDLRIDYVADLLLRREIAVQFGALPPQPEKINKAKEIAKKSDMVIVFASDLKVEGGDQSTLDLPGDQNRLIKEIVKVNPNTVVVLNTGGAVLMPWIDDVAGVIEAWYPGQQNGNALANILTGVVNPSGRLPITFPAKDSDSPVADPERWPGVNGAAKYSEGLLVGYRWYDSKKNQTIIPIRLWNVIYDFQLLASRSYEAW